MYRDISVCTAIMINDHSNPYLAVLSGVENSHASFSCMVYCLYIITCTCMYSHTRWLAAGDSEPAAVSGAGRGGDEAALLAVRLLRGGHERQAEAHLQTPP